MKTPSDIAIKITHDLFKTSCEHCDDGQCDRCINDYFPETIMKALYSYTDEVWNEAIDKASEISSQSHASADPIEIAFKIRSI